jgi:DNA mismatch repair ATPase MutL
LCFTINKKGFGDKICKLIDNKLKKFLDNGGNLHENEDDEEDRGDLSEITNRNQSINKKKKNNNQKSSPSSSVKSKSKLKNKSIDEINLDNDNDNIEMSPSSSTNKPSILKTKSKKSKEYLPEYRSGPYALLITLLNNQEDKMLKQNLINEAQDHCDSSFTVVKLLKLI